MLGTSSVTMALARLLYVTATSKRCRCGRAPPPGSASRAAGLGFRPQLAAQAPGGGAAVDAGAHDRPDRLAHVVQVERVLEVGRETAQAERRSASVPRCHLAQDLPDKPLRIFPVALRRGGQYGVLLMEDLAAHIRAKIAAGTLPSLPTALGSCGPATATDGSATPATGRSPPPIES